MVNAGTLALAICMGACAATAGCGAASSSKGDGATDRGDGATNEGDGGVDRGDDVRDEGDGVTDENDGGAAEGDGGAAASLCGQAQPCGGELTGTWKMIAMCIVDPSFLGIDTSPICPAATLDSGQSRISGVIMFGYPIYSQPTPVSEMPALKVTIPSSCLSAGQTCTDLDRSYSQAVLSNPKLQSASCMTSGANCVCSFVGADPGSPWLGVYNQSGDYVSLTRQDAFDSYPYAYCVQGNQLHLMALGITKNQPVLTDIVMERQ